MAQTWQKKDREQKRQKEKNAKVEKMQQRKENSTKKSFDDMIAYLDENGNLTSQPPDPRKKIEVRLEDIQISVPEYIPPTKDELTHTGKVTFFNTAKGFGFIKDLASQQSIFVHANNLESAISENDIVSFEIEAGQRGPAAVKVKVIN
jgi:cold shock CspA family protein